MNRNWLQVLSASFLIITMPAIFAGDFRNTEVDDIIASDQRPEGIVFELIEFDDDVWTWAAPMLRSLTRQLEEKYPSLDRALVSHGAEIFDLAKESGNQDKEEIQQLSILADEGLEVHVCGTYASYKHLEDNDFLSFVDVAPSAPAQLNDYIKLGFVPILLRKPDVSD